MFTVLDSFVMGLLCWVLVGSGVFVCAGSVLVFLVWVLVEAPVVAGLGLGSRAELDSSFCQL